MRTWPASNRFVPARAFIKSSFPLFTGFHIHGNRVSWVTSPNPPPTFYRTVYRAVNYET